MKTIVLCNEKGGVGKSTTACFLSQELRIRGYKVLLCDCDPQGNTSDTMKSDSEHVGVYELFTKPQIESLRAVQKVEYGYLIAGDHRLRDLEETARAENISIYTLRNKLSELSSYFDYCVIDTPPNLGFLLLSSLTAGNTSVIPMACDRYSIQGLLELYEAITMVQEEYNSDLQISGILLTKYSDRAKFSQQVRGFIEDLANDMGTKVFAQTIRNSIRVQEAQTMNVPLQVWDKSGKCTEDYRKFVDEFLLGGV